MYKNKLLVDPVGRNDVPTSNAWVACSTLSNHRKPEVSSFGPISDEDLVKLAWLRCTSLEIGDRFQAVSNFLSAYQERTYEEAEICCSNSTQCVSRAFAPAATIAPFGSSKKAGALIAAGLNSRQVGTHSRQTGSKADRSGTNKL